MRLQAKCLGVSAAALMVSMTALAADEKAASVNVTTGADSASLGGEFRAELNVNDHKLDKEDDFNPKQTTRFEVQTAQVKLGGMLNKNTEYKFRFNLLGTGSPFDYGYGTHWAADTFGFSIGKMKVLQGGWDQMDCSFRDHAKSTYRSSMMTFNSYEPMLALHLKLMGKVSLQVLNDVNTAGTAGKMKGTWNEKEHPTWVAGWQGDINGIMPLLSVGSYDNNKSMYFDVGFKLKLMGVDSSLDFSQNTTQVKGVNPTKPTESKGYKNVASNFTLHAKYEIKDAAKPFLYFSTTSVKQADDKDAGLEDAEFNSAPPDSATGQPVKKWNDNGQVLGIGTDLLMLGKGWSPYVAYVMESGKWPDPKKATDAKKYSNGQIRIGALGEF